MTTRGPSTASATRSKTRHFLLALVAGVTALAATPVAEAGERLVKQHFCSSCHTPALMGQKHIPRLAGQQQEYLLKQLRGFKAQTAADLDGSMTMSAQPLSAQDIELLADYLAHLPPGGGS